MRKDTLQRLLKKHDKSWSVLISNLTSKEDSRITVLRKFLDSDAIKLLPDNADITFGMLIEYWERSFVDSEQKPRFSVSDFVGKNSPAAKLFNEFMSAEAKPSRNFGTLATLLDEMIIEISSKSSDREIKSLSQTSSSFYSLLQQEPVWFNKLLEAGCSNALLMEVRRSKKIKDYKKLYEAFIRVAPGLRGKLRLGDMLCLSGDPRAMSAALEDGVTEAYGMLDYAALAGSISGIEYALTRGPNRQQDLMASLALTARSGNVPAFSHFRKRVIMSTGNGLFLFEEYLQILQMAYLSANMEMVDYVHGHQEFYGSDNYDFFDFVLKVMAVAISKGNQSLILKIADHHPQQFKSVFESRYTRLVKAAITTGNLGVFNTVWQLFPQSDLRHISELISHAIAKVNVITPVMVEHVISQVIEELTTELEDIRITGKNILQIAAAHCSPDFVLHIRKICAQFDTGITPSTPDPSGRTALDDAASDEVREALTSSLSTSLNIRC